MNNLDVRIADLPLAVIDTLLDIEELNDMLKLARHDDLFSPEVEREAFAGTGSLRKKESKAAKDTDIMVKRKEWEAHAYCDVLKFMFENYRDIEISEACIMSLHRELYHYSPESVWYKGKYKTGENKVETKDFKGKTLRVWMEGMPHEKAPDALRSLIRWYNESPTAIKYPPLLRISAFMVEFFRIHPFLDGNGRVGRALVDLLMLKAGYVAELYYPFEKIIEEDTQAYFNALNHSQKTFGTDAESMRAWNRYFLETVLEQYRRAVAITAPVKHRRKHAAAHK